MLKVKVTILGSGTSHGVPVIGCDCPVCQSDDPKNKRTRASVLIESGAAAILIDTSTEFRIQAIREGISRLDAVLYTHPHADHLHGLDDVRSLTWNTPLPLFATEKTEQEIRIRFDYIFQKTQKGGGKPNVYFERLDNSLVEIKGTRILPIEVLHGELPVLGFRVGDFVYITDCSFIPKSSYQRLAGTKTLIIGALRDKPHATHFNVDEAVEASRIIGAEHTYLTHICHDLEHGELLRRLPDGVTPAYDGLSIEIEGV